MGKGHTTKTKKNNVPKVRFQDRTYDVIGKTGDMIRVNDGFAEFSIRMDLTTPANKEAREMFKGA